MWRVCSILARHQESRRPQLRRLTHDNENVVGGEPELWTRRRDFATAPTDREHQRAGLGTQTGRGEGLADGGESEARRSRSTDERICSTRRWMSERRTL